MTQSAKLSGLTECCTICGGELVVLGARLLSGSGAWLLSTNLKKGEEQKEVLEAKDDEEKESEVDGKVEEGVTQLVRET